MKIVFIVGKSNIKSRKYLICMLEKTCSFLIVFKNLVINGFEVFECDILPTNAILSFSHFPYPNTIINSREVCI